MSHIKKQHRTSAYLAFSAGADYAQNCHERNRKTFMYSFIKLQQQEKLGFLPAGIKKLKEQRTVCNTSQTTCHITTYPSL